jgi:hypothetical protein
MWSAAPNRTIDVRPSQQPSFQRMPITLFLIEARARTSYRCEACNEVIGKGTRYFRHDPFPGGFRAGGGRYRRTHWCRACIDSSDPGEPDPLTQRIRIPIVRVVREGTEALVRPIRVQLVGISDVLRQQLAKDPALMTTLSPSTFEELICDRLSAMGLEPRRVGTTNRKDGGIDILFWPRKATFPFLGAAQIKHHRSLGTTEGPASVREFAGALSRIPVTAGILVTNTTFTPDATWFANQLNGLVRLRQLPDVSRWLRDQFGEEEWRELPESIELCPGVVIRLR